MIADWRIHVSSLRYCDHPPIVEQDQQIAGVDNAIAVQALKSDTRAGRLRLVQMASNAAAVWNGSTAHAMLHVNPALREPQAAAFTATLLVGDRQSGRRTCERNRTIILTRSN
jgi:hypothetical protein